MLQRNQYETHWILWKLILCTTTKHKIHKIQFSLDECVLPSMILFWTCVSCLSVKTANYFCFCRGLLPVGQTNSFFLVLGIFFLKMSIENVFYSH